MTPLERHNRRTEQLYGYIPPQLDANKEPDLVSKIMDYEQSHTDPEQTIQRHYGRTATDLISAGLCRAA